MTPNDAIDYCHQWLRDHAAEAPGLMDQLRAGQAARDIVYDGKPMPTFLRPVFFTAADEAMLRRSSECLLTCAERILEVFGENAEVRRALGPEALRDEEFLLQPSGLSRQVHVSRPDGFLVDGNMQYLELNAESPGGVVWVDVHEEAFAELPFMQAPWAQTLGRSRGRELLLGALRTAAADFGISTPLRAAVVDWREVPTRREFGIVADYFNANDLPTVVVDPRTFELRGDTLYADGEAINLVYRRVIASELLEKRDEPGIRDFLEAYRRHLVCVVNPLCSKIAGLKSVMSILTDARFEGLFTAEQNASNARHIPWTRLIQEGPTTYEGEETELFELLRMHRENLVIKPTNGYGGHGVTIGRETDQGRWEGLLNDAARAPGGWTAQRFVEIPEEDFPILEPELGFEPLKVNLNPFVLGGQYAGSMMRMSKSSVINVSAGGGLGPAFVMV